MFCDSCGGFIGIGAKRYAMPKTSCPHCFKTRKKREQEAFRRKYPLYLRERKKLYERASRGRSLTWEQYRQWRAENTPEKWRPFSI